MLQNCIKPQKMHTKLGLVMVSQEMDPYMRCTGVAEHSVNMPYGTLNPMRTDYEENH